MALLRYCGGKVFLTKQILPHISIADSPMAVYCEPFVGGASVGLAVAQKYPNVRIVLNDLDFSVATLWGLIASGSDSDFLALQNQVLTCQPTVERFRDLQNSQPTHPVEIAFRALYLNRTGYASSNGKRPLGGWDQNGEEAIDSRWNSTRLAAEMVEARQLLHGRTTVFNEDFADVMTLAEDDWTMYLDPPYYKAGNQLYNFQWADEDHVRLRDILKTTPADWVLSYDFHPRVVELYNHGMTRAYPVPARYSMSKRREVEAIIVPSRVRKTGYVVPADFAEFFERYPDWVRTFVQRKMRWSQAKANAMEEQFTVFDATIDDYTQDLLLFLSTLPADSKYREIGFSDPIQLFNPSLWGAVNQGKFLAYVTMIAGNKFHTLRTHEYKDALPYADLSLGTIREVNSFDELAVDFQLYRSFIERERPILLKCFDSFFDDSLRPQIQNYDAQRARVISTLREYFVKGRIPEKRKEYKKREKVQPVLTGEPGEMLAANHFTAYFLEKHAPKPPKEKRKAACTSS